MEEFEDTVIETRYYEREAKAFKLSRIDPHGMWVIKQATGRGGVPEAISGNYTSAAEAIKAINRLPDSYFKPTPMKTVLTPKEK